MKSIRLNKTLREEIISNIEQAYEIATPCPPNKSKQELRNELFAVIETEYRRQAKVFETKALKAGIPLNIIQTRSRIVVFSDAGNYWDDHYMHNADGDIASLIDVCPNAAFIQLDQLEKYPLIQEAYNKYKKDLKNEKANTDLKRIWEREKSNYLSDVRNVIYGVNTTAQLLEQWEEVKAFLPAGIVNPSRIMLPAVNIKQLNKKIGL